jgi:hypothetical protein
MKEISELEQVIQVLKEPSTTHDGINPSNLLSTLVEKTIAQHIDAEKPKVLDSAKQSLLDIFHTELDKALLLFDENAAELWTMFQETQTTLVQQQSNPSQSETIEHDSKRLKREPAE